MTKLFAIRLKPNEDLQQSLKDFSIQQNIQVGFILTAIPTERFAIAFFQNYPNYRDKCFTALRIAEPSKIIDGIDLMAADFNLNKTTRTFSESQQDWE